MNEIHQPKISKKVDLTETSLVAENNIKSKQSTTDLQITHLIYYEKIGKTYADESMSVDYLTSVFQKFAKNLVTEKQS